jgi:hypothetical protein
MFLFCRIFFSICMCFSVSFSMEEVIQPLHSCRLHVYKDATQELVFVYKGTRLRPDALNKRWDVNPSEETFLQSSVLKTWLLSEADKSFLEQGLQSSGSTLEADFLGGQPTRIQQSAYLVDFLDKLKKLPKMIISDPGEATETWFFERWFSTRGLCCVGATAAVVAYFSTCRPSCLTQIGCCGGLFTYLNLRG